MPPARSVFTAYRDAIPLLSGPVAARVASARLRGNKGPAATRRCSRVVGASSNAAKAIKMIKVRACSAAIAWGRPVGAASPARHPPRIAGAASALLVSSRCVRV